MLLAGLFRGDVASRTVTNRWLSKLPSKAIDDRKERLAADGFGADSGLSASG